MQIPLKITTEYTLLTSLITIDNLFPFLEKNKINTVGICDKNLLGANLFYSKCISSGIKPIIGLDTKLNDKDIYIYAKNYEGYLNLLKIDYLSQKNDISPSILLKYEKNIIIVIPYSNRSLINMLKDFDIYISYDNLDEKNNIIKNNYKPLYVPSINVIEEENKIYLDYLELIKLGKKEEDLQKKEHISLEKLISLKEENKYNEEFINGINLVFPTNYNYLPKYITDKEPFNLLKSLCLKGLKKRLHDNINNTYLKRLDYELNIINDMGFVDYFLIVYDYVLYAKKNNIAVGPGRGSAAGSLVSYSLGITNIDPLKYNLLFERFLNPSRVTMPDIDIDFEDEYRYDVINYVKNKYGFDKVGLIVTYGTLLSKQALRDAARVLSVPDDKISHLIKYIDSDKSLDENLNDKVKEILSKDKLLNKTYILASKIYGLKRHTSTHAAGVVISKCSLYDIVPTIVSNDDLIVGLTMNELESNGLLKMDFLGLKNLSTIKYITNKINEKGYFNLNEIPLDDKKTFDLLKEGNTLGVFQFETSGMQNLLLKLKPNNFNDLVAAVALFRPGPMDNIDLYIKNKNTNNIKYPDESLIPILKETYGVIIYQEQIMQILQKMALYSYAEADLIRRAMSKKKEEIILNHKSDFISRSVKNNYKKETAEEVFNLILKFANYGFNKAHSVSYALIGYEMAYLKANYPDIFIVSNLNIFGKAQVKCKEYISEGIKYHFKFHKPLINKSSNEFISSGINILLPYNQIIGISEDLAIKISKEQNIKPFTDIFDFLRRMPENTINKDYLLKLINADVFKPFSYNKKTLIENIDTLMNYRDLAFGLDDESIKKPYLIIDKEYDVKELRKIEFDTFGYYVSNHPSQGYQNNVCKCINVKSFFDKNVNMILLIEKINIFKTKKNEDMASIVASDETGTIEVTVFPNNYKDIFNLTEGDLILVKGKIGKRFSDYQIISNKILKYKEK